MTDNWAGVEEFLDDTLGGPGSGKFLNLLTRMVDAKRVLEIGAQDGRSTVWLARGVGPSGRVVTLVSNTEHASMVRSDLEGAESAEAVEIVVGPAVTTLHSVRTDDDSSFDLVLVDAVDENSAQYVEWALVLGRPGTVVVLGNVVRGGEVLDESSSDPAVRGTREVLALLASHPRLDAAALQTVGTAGWDGFAVALVVE
ncbi:O-methyltransferase [Rhodococcoides trifolii]|uniref:O-methyltransferase n=1 Tax=Rhodococcoides trifolii TaxID=908250 RepID=A0A917D244_9NOCA|nr:class I SAM-dependent methyltransferase [Rhodococcus trifolii]GGG07560.1 O-methyltransferase [Rhodococcus trifolii]